MTKKDYQLIADAIASTQRIPLNNVHFVVGAIARALATDNPRFDRARFIRACGYVDQN